MSSKPRSAPPPAILLAAQGLRIGGGIASVSRCIARALEEQSESGGVSRVDRVLLNEDPETAFPRPRRGVQKLARGSQARYVAQLWGLLLRHRHDLILFDQVGLARSVQFPLPFFCRPRYHIFIHGIELPRATAGSYRRAFEGATVILSNSEATARSFERLFPDLASKVAVTRLCIDPERIALWAGLRRPPDDPGRERAVLTTGRMWAEERGKGHDALLESWIEVRRRVPDAQLWVVGEGDDRPRLTRKAADLQVADSVRFLGYTSDEELGALYSRAAVFALPSKQEGFGLVYAEAMWHGIPCLAAISEAPREVLVEGETGVLVPYGDTNAIATSLIELLSDPERRITMGRAGRRRAEELFVYDRFKRDLLANLRSG